MNDTPKRRAPLEGTTIRSRITLSMLYAAALVIPVVIVSLFYIRHMNDAVTRIATQDIELMQVGDRVSLVFLQARRDEKNFLLFRDSTYLAENRAALGQIEQLCTRGKKLAPDLTPEFEAIAEHVSTYRSLADSLFRLPRLEARTEAASPDLARLRRSHQTLLDAADAAADSSQRDSLLAMARQLALEISTPVYAGAPGWSLNDSIRSLQASLTDQTDSIIAYARQRVQSHQQRARRLSTWGQRNIVTVLLIVVIVLAWLIVVLPRRAVLSIRRIANALKRVEEGNLDIHIKLRTKDELGELARQLNRALAYLRDFDDRKVSRILQLERRFKLLINDIAEGVVVVDRTPRIVQANEAMEQLLGCKVSETTGRRLKDFQALRFLFEPLEKVLAGSTSHQTCDILPEMPGSVVCIESLRDKAGDVTGALIVISRPARPEAPEPSGEPPA